MKPGKRRRFPPFVALSREMLRSIEWRTGLIPSEKILYIHLKSKFVGHNNGELYLHYSEMEDMMATGTIAQAFKGLIEKGWIAKEQHIGGKYRFQVKYRLTGKCDSALSNRNL